MKKNQNFFHPAQKTVLDCEASLKCFELNVKTMTQNRNKPRAAKSCKQFKKFFENI